jgi:ribosomal protein L1
VVVVEHRDDIRSAYQLLQEPAHVVLIQQLVPVLGECGRMPDSINGAKSIITASCS